MELRLGSKALPSPNALNCIYPPGPGKTAGQALAFTFRDRSFSGSSQWGGEVGTGCGREAISLERGQREQERPHVGSGGCSAEERSAHWLWSLYSLERMNRGNEGERFLSNTTDLVEVSLLLSETGTWGREENVSSSMTHGLMTRNIVLNYIYAVVHMYKR